VTTNIIRRSFFIDRNMAMLNEEARTFRAQMSAARKIDHHYDLLYDLISYFLIDRQDPKQRKMETAIRDFERRKNSTAGD
jgi:hypothetical protein